MIMKSFSRNLSILSFIGCWLLASSACSTTPAPMPTPANTPTETLTPAPTGTPTLAPTDTLIPTPVLYPAAWGGVFSDSFDNNNNNWPYQKSSSSIGTSQGSVQDGQYIINVKCLSADGYIGALIPQSVSNVADFYLAVDAQQTDGMPSEYGIVFRFSANGYYEFMVFPSVKKYVLVMYQQKTGKLMNVINYTLTSSINSDKANRLGVTAIGNSITLFINNKQINKITDDNFANGVFGLSFGMVNLNDTATIAFDNLEIFAP